MRFSAPMAIFGSLPLVGVRVRVRVRVGVGVRVGVESVLELELELGLTRYDERTLKPFHKLNNLIIFNFIL